jgi:hypothetical protein
MKGHLIKALVGLACLALLLLAGGCTTAEMKGTPFYSGEYGKRNGPAEQRVNGWPLVYYRDPALSVLWPVFESTDDHTAVRPIFSVYGLDRTNREYNVLWPLAQFDRQERENRIFPFFWGDDYRVLFPLYWHYDQPFGTDGGTDSLFPLWLLSRERTNDFSLFAPWPLVRVWSHAVEHDSGSMVFPLYWHDRDDRGSLFVSLPWMSGSDAQNGDWRLLPPIFFQTSNALHTAIVTPLWASGHTETNDWNAVIPLAYWDRQQHTLLSPLWAHWQTGDWDHYLAPWLISWTAHSANRSDLWLAGGLAKLSWGHKSGSHYAFPFYYRNADRRTLLTPLCGWNGNRGYYYPLTPLFGVRTGLESGSWLFPIYSHSNDKVGGTVSDHFLLLGGHRQSQKDRHSWFLPIFSYHNYGSLAAAPEKPAEFRQYGREFWCLPWCWFENLYETHPSRRQTFNTNLSDPVGESQSQSAQTEPTNRTRITKEYSFKNGVFPFWSYSHRQTPERGASTVKGSALLLLYDYKHELGPNASAKPGTTNDYTRARVCWRLWHYERLNGNVSLDVFPTFTYDSKTNGFTKTSFLWRLFRYERAPGSTPALDVLFIPLARPRSATLTTPLEEPRSTPAR